MTQDVIQRVAQACGNMATLARELGITRAAVAQWDKIPAERCLTIERLTGISRYELRPDIYGEKP